MGGLFACVAAYWFDADSLSTEVTVQRSGKMNLTVGEMQGHLRQLLESSTALSAEQRYSIMASIETLDFLKRLAPGLRKALEERKDGRRTTRNGSSSTG